MQLVRGRAGIGTRLLLAGKFTASTTGPRDLSTVQPGGGGTAGGASLGTFSVQLLAPLFHPLFEPLRQPLTDEAAVPMATSPF